MTICYKLVGVQESAEKYLEDICVLMNDINKQKAAPFLNPPNQEFFAKSLTKGKVNLFAFFRDKLVGYAFLKMLEEWPSYLGVMAFPVKESAMVLFTIVDPKFRGQGIHKELTRLRIQEAQKEGKKYLISTVDPKNTASLKTLEFFGFKCIEQREIFENKLLRKIMLLKL